jgi:hypothetical protein
MFKKHIYTCPDVIYLRNRNCQILTANFAVIGIMLSVLWGYGTYLEKQEKKRLLRSVEND